MEKMNKKMLLVLGVLLLLGGISFAYFVGTSLFEGTGSKTEAITASIKGATVNVEGGLTFNDLDILPGHQTVSSIKVTATGNNELIPYNLIWSGTNSLNTPLEFKVYKTSNEVDVSISCDKKTKVENGYQILNEECSIFNLDKLGSVVSSGTIETATDTTKVVLASDEFITATSDGMSVYYYVILEYPNLDEEQNADMGGNFNGTVTVEESNAKPDINILAVKIEQEDGTYKDSGDIPQEGYRLNTENSICSNGATAGWDTNNNRFYTDNLTKKGTSCYLYFDEICGNACKTILKNSISNGKKTAFTGIATEEDTGLYEAPDDFGTSYYFRGIESKLNNWVKFAGYYWRIIRINGNGSIRMIYSGIANGLPNDLNKTGMSMLINEEKYYYNNKYDDNTYIGYMHTLDNNGHTNSSNAHQNNYDSTVKTVIDEWYKLHILDNNYSKYIDKDAGFCNDRLVDKSADSRWQGDGYYNQLTGYAPWGRLHIGNWKSTQNPILHCPDIERDLFTYLYASNGNKALKYPIGMLSSDEVIFAGGFGNTQNYTYYLNINETYLTMSPSHTYSSDIAMFLLRNDGYFTHSTVSFQKAGLRPVINIKPETKFIGCGSNTDPYIVVDAE